MTVVYYTSHLYHMTGNFCRFPQGNEHLAKVIDIRCLVVDEADRMVEKGHFEELTKLLDYINA